MEYLINTLPDRIPIGNQGEKNAVTVDIDIEAWQIDHPTGAVVISPDPGVADGIYLSYTRPGSPAVYPEYPAALALTGKVLSWTLSENVLDYPGYGTVVVHCMEGSVEKRANMTQIYIAPGHGAAGTAPPPLADYIEKWGSVDALAYLIINSLNPAVSVTQDATGTHFSFGIPLNALMRDIENTLQTPTFNSDGTVAQIVHTDLDTLAVVRTDTFVYDGFLITQTRTLEDGSYLVITTNTNTMDQTISDIAEGA